MVSWLIVDEWGTCGSADIDEDTYVCSSDGGSNAGRMIGPIVVVPLNDEMQDLYYNWRTTFERLINLALLFVAS